MNLDLPTLEGSFAPHDARGIVEWSVRTFGDALRLACSGSVEDALLLHLLADAAKRAGASPRVLVLDTGRLHEETHQVLDRLRSRYDLPIDVLFPRGADLEALVSAAGPLSFYASMEARRACCQVRKVEPLCRGLAGARAWMTGLRRAQSQTRGELSRLAWDPEGRLKLSPLAHFADDHLWAEARALDVVVHPLHAAGYPSIGCAPCTRAVAPGEDPRAGRWWWEAPEHKECGIHLVQVGRR